MDIRISNLMKVKGQVEVESLKSYLRERVCFLTLTELPRHDQSKGTMFSAVHQRQTNWRWNKFTP